MPYSKKKLAEYTREASECFAYNDRDNDGKVASSDLLPLMQSMGQYPTPIECENLLKAIGAKATFKLADFLQMLKEHQKNSVMWEDELIEAFRQFDADGDGHISATEITHAVTTIGAKLSKDQAKAFVREADTSGNGMINYQEFVRLMTSGRQSSR